MFVLVTCLAATSFAAGLVEINFLRPAAQPPRVAPPLCLAKRKSDSQKRRRQQRRKKPSEAAGSGIEAMVERQHRENCEAGANTFRVCETVGAGTYTGAWEEYILPPNTVAPGNAPYDTDRLLLKSCAPLMGEADCARLIELAEEHARTTGWDTRYPVDGFTHEVNAADIPEAREIVSTALDTALLPAAAAQFPTIPASSLRVYNALVVKYDAASGHNCLPVHQDFGILTYNVALSESGAYDGGGTWFQHSGETLLASRGEAVLHAGRLVHCGVPVSRGSRYQLVIFLITTRFADVAGRLQAIGAAAGAKARGELQDIPLSTSALQRSLAVNPLDCESWTQLGANRRAAADLAAAEECFDRVVQLSRGRDFSALCSLAAVQHERGNFSAALASLEAALLADAPPGPTQAAERLGAQHSAGMALLGMELWEEAGVVFEQVISQDDDAIESWSALGVCMARLDQPEAALACQRQVLRIRSQALPA